MFKEPHKILTQRKFVKSCYDFNHDCQYYSAKYTIKKFIDDGENPIISEEELEKLLDKLKENIKDDCVFIPVGSSLVEVLFEDGDESFYFILDPDNEYICEGIYEKIIGKYYDKFLEKY